MGLRPSGESLTREEFETKYRAILYIRMLPAIPVKISNWESV
jgi:hypothetical protein